MMTNASDPGAPASGTPSSTWKPILIYGAIGIGVMFLMDMLIWWERGGLFSIFWAIGAVDAKARSIDVDSAGLRFLFIVLSCLVIAFIGQLLRGDLDKRWTQFLVISAMIGGGFVLDGVYGERIITHYMAAHGYVRCPLLDREVGNGKGRVWFVDYVRFPADCRTTPEKGL